MGKRGLNVLLLGIGNILFQDEGMGAHFIHYMDEKFEFRSKENSTLSIVDGGTLAQRLIPEIVKYDEVIIVDCVDAINSSPGDVYFFDYNNTPLEVNWQGSAHEVEMLQTLNMIDMSRDLPSTHVLGIIPKRVADDTTFELSHEIIAAVETMQNCVIEHLEKLGIELHVRNEHITIEQMAQMSYKREIINNPVV